MLVPDGIPTTDVVGIILETKRLCIDLELDLFSIPSSDGQSRVFVPGSPWVESNPELFSKEHLKACIWNGVEIPVRPER